MESNKEYWCINKGCGGDPCTQQCDFCQKDDNHYKETGKLLGSFYYKSTDVKEAKKQTKLFINNLK